MNQNVIVFKYGPHMTIDGIKSMECPRLHGRNYDQSTKVRIITPKSNPRYKLWSVHGLNQYSIINPWSKEWTIMVERMDSHGQNYG